MMGVGARRTTWGATSKHQDLDVKRGPFRVRLGLDS